MMRVKCVSNRASSLPAAYHDVRQGYGPDHVFPVTVGQDYVVFAMTTYLGGMWIYIADDQFSYYPVWRPTPLFEIVDGRISKTWRVGLQGPEGHREWVLAYREWAEDPLYYERLVNRDEMILRSFLFHKKLLEDEFGVS